MVTLHSHTELHVIRKGILHAECVIQTDGMDTEEIRTSLTQFIPEKTNQSEQFIDFLIRKLKL